MPVISPCSTAGWMQTTLACCRSPRTNCGRLAELYVSCLLQYPCADETSRETCDTCGEKQNYSKRRNILCYFLVPIRCKSKYKFQRRLL